MIPSYHASGVRAVSLAVQNGLLYNDQPMISSLRSDFRNLVMLALFGAALYGIGLGASGLIDPDEPFYALTAKEMVVRHDWMTPYIFGQPQFEKPIFFYWVLCFFYKIFGVSSFSARLGPSLASAVLGLVVYLWSRVLFRRRAIAMVSAFVFMTCAEVVGMAHIVLTDVFLTLFVTAALLCWTLIERDERHRIRWALLGSLFCALGFLTKGPLGVLVPLFGIVPYLIYTRQMHLLRRIPWIGCLAVFCGVGLPWYILMTQRHGMYFLSHFFYHENVNRFFVAEHPHNDRFYFYPATLLVGFFPWTAFLPGTIAYPIALMRRKTGRYRNAFLFLFSCAVIPLIFFSFARSKLLSYILPIFPPFAILMGAWLYRTAKALSAGARPSRGLSFLAALILGIVPALVVLATGIYSIHQNLGVGWPLVVIGLTFVPLCWVAFLFFMKKRFAQGCAALGAGVFFFAAVAFTWILPVCDRNFSVDEQAGVFKSLTPSPYTGLILANRSWVRGVSHYTDDPNVGVINADKKGVFYTAHPIPIFSSLEDFEKLPASDFPLYCFLSSKQTWWLIDRVKDKYKVTVLDKNPLRVLVRMDPK